MAATELALKALVYEPCVKHSELNLLNPALKHRHGCINTLLPSFFEMQYQKS